MKKQRRTTKERWRIFKIRFKNNWFVAEVIGWWYHIIKMYCFNSAKRRAKKWSKKTNGRRYYVVPVSNYLFRVMSNLERKQFNRNVSRRFRINFMKMDNISYWHTDLKSI